MTGKRVEARLIDREGVTLGNVTLDRFLPVIEVAAPPHLTADVLSTDALSIQIQTREFWFEREHHGTYIYREKLKFKENTDG